MTDDTRDTVEFDAAIGLALAEDAAVDAAPLSPAVKERLLARIRQPAAPAGFSFTYDRDADWRPHPVPGIRFKLLSLNETSRYATLLLDVAPGTRFPAHHHKRAEECYVVAGSLYTCGRRLVAGDFVHADEDTPHEELWTEEGCRVLLVVSPEDYMQRPTR
jgi:anti-sigma factor ChrR (cupin superfamily)